MCKLKGQSSFSEKNKEIMAIPLRFTDIVSKSRILLTISKIGRSEKNLYVNKLGLAANQDGRQAEGERGGAEAYEKSHRSSLAEFPDIKRSGQPDKWEKESLAPFAAVFCSPKIGNGPQSWLPSEKNS